MLQFFMFNTASNTDTFHSLPAFAGQLHLVKDRGIKVIIEEVDGSLVTSKHYVEIKTALESWYNQKKSCTGQRK